jgi:glycerol-3-phosphate dehydrogenase (NAD(P)+)
MNDVTYDVLVLGGGAWGTALAIQAHRAGARTALWLRDPGRAAALASSRLNPHLPGMRLPAAIAVSADANLPASLRLLVVPVQHMRSVAQTLSGAAPIVSCGKGFELGSGQLPLEILAQVSGGLVTGALSGPNFALEVASGQPAASVIASENTALRDHVAQCLGAPSFRLYGNDDPIGVQIGGAAKNVIAIAAGAVVGAGLGENARAALVTRGLAELSRLATVLGGRAETIAGLSGMGDLLLTCTGCASRNYTLGHALGRGHSLADAVRHSAGVAEGVTTAPALCERADRLGLELPICAAVADLVAGRTSVAEAITALLARPRKNE